MVKKTIAMLLVIMLAYTMLPWAGVPTGFTVARAADYPRTAEASSWSDMVDKLTYTANPHIYLKNEYSAGWILYVSEGYTLELTGKITLEDGDGQGEDDFFYREDYGGYRDEARKLYVYGGGTIKRVGNWSGPLFDLSSSIGGEARLHLQDIIIDGNNGTAPLISVPYSVSGGWEVDIGVDQTSSSSYELTTFQNNGGPAIEVTEGDDGPAATIKLYNADFAKGMKAVAAASGLGDTDAINLRIYPDYFTQSTTIDLSGLKRSQIETVYQDADDGGNLVKGNENSSDTNPQIVTIIPWSDAETGDCFGLIENDTDNDKAEEDVKVFDYPRLVVEEFEIATECIEVYEGSAFILRLGAKKSDGGGAPGEPAPAPVFWPVTVTYGKGGTAWASAETVENGGSVDITAQPYDYRKIADVKVNGESVGAVSSYTIENITGPVAVEVIFVYENSFADAGGQDERDDSESESGLGWGAGYGSASLLFRDVYPWHPAYSAISFVTDRGLMNGVGGGLFDPDNGVTRAMMATILWRMEGQPATYGDTGFSDVPAGQWYSQAITWANRAGIIEGYGKGIYGLNDQVTHEQVCAMLYRWHSGGYATVDAAYAWAQSNGLYDGMSAESDEIATRGEIAQLLMAFAVRVW